MAIKIKLSFRKGSTSQLSNLSWQITNLHAEMDKKKSYLGNLCVKEIRV